MALTKIDDRGLKTPIDLLDNEKIRLGTGNDLELYHNGTNNYLDTTNGHLYLRVNSTENAIKCTQNGNVEISYDGSKKLETVSYGTITTGESRADNFQVLDYDGSSTGLMKFGAGDDLKIYHNGTHSYIDNQTGALYLRNNTGTYNGNPIVLEALSGENALVANPNGAVELYYDNAKRLFTRSNGITVQGNGSGSGIDFQTDTTHRGTVWADSSNQIGFLDTGGDWAIKHTNDDSTKFYVQTNQKATIDADGLKFGTDSAAANALDDYEEGTWTPAYANVTTPTYDVQTGRYTKVGRFVYCTGRLSVQGGTALDTSDGSGVNIGGLPFTGNNDHHACLLTLGRFLSIFQDGGASVNTVRFNGDGIMLMTANGNEVTYTECNAFGDLTFAISYQL